MSSKFQAGDEINTTNVDNSLLLFINMNIMSIHIICQHIKHSLSVSSTAIKALDAHDVILTKSLGTIIEGIHQSIRVTTVVKTQSMT